MGKPTHHTDPVTGDALSTSEWLSWQVQGIIRRWSVLGIILAVTLACWLTGNPVILLWWNLAASLAAICIEFVVGLAMFGQTRRDAKVIRHSEKMSVQIDQHVRATARSLRIILGVLVVLGALQFLVLRRARKPLARPSWPQAHIRQS